VLMQQLGTGNSTTSSSSTVILTEEGLSFEAMARGIATCLVEDMTSKCDAEYGVTYADLYSYLWIGPNGTIELYE
jgi:hypothetical protein